MQATILAARLSITLCDNSREQHTVLGELEAGATMSAGIMLGHINILTILHTYLDGYVSPA